MTIPKLITSVRLPSAETINITNIDGVAVTQTAAITAGLYYITQDGTSSDFLAELLFVASGVTVTFTLVNGCVRATRSGGVSITFNLSDAPLTAAYIRFPTTSIALVNNTYTATSKHVGGLYPLSGLQVDLQIKKPMVSQFKPDRGNTQTLWLNSCNEWRLGVRLSGFPRGDGSTRTEYHEGQDWLDQVATGVPFRLYSDATVTTAYSSTNLYGYQTMTAQVDSITLDPENDGWYKNWQLRLLAREYT